MKIIVCLIFIWKMVDTLQSAALSCAKLQQPHLWRQHGGSCYLFLAAKRDRGPAGDFCRSRCAELTTPTTVRENELVWGMFRDGVDPLNLKSKKKMWLGCNNTNGAWVCLGDTPGRKYRNLLNGHEPTIDNACAVMRYQDGKWEGPECGITWQKFTLCKTPAADGPIFRTLKCTSMPIPNGLCPDPVHTVKVTSPMQCCLACAKQCDCRSFSLTHTLDCRMNLGKLNDTGTALRNQKCEYYEYEMQV